MRKNERWRDTLTKHLEALERQCEEVRKAVLSLHLQEEYPSIRKVRKLLSKPPSMIEREVSDAYRETLRLFGIREEKPG